MFYYLSGTLAHTEPYLAVLDVGGAGYACRTSLNTLALLSIGEPVRLYTYLHVREDILDLYGFLSQSELNCFKMLIEVSGVGPKAALSVLSAVTPERLAIAVLNADEQALTGAKGVGKKLAQRVILELRDKFSKQYKGLPSAADGTAVPRAASGAGEAVDALRVLGYSKAEAEAALSGIDLTHTPVEEAIRLALRNMLR